MALIRELCENANTYTPLGPGEERIVDGRFVLWLGSSADPHANVAQRFRIDADGVATVVEEVRALVAARGRSSCTWEIGESATPSDLVDRLLAAGCVPDAEPLAVGMVLTEPPADDRTGIVARAVETAAEMEAATRIAHDAFGLPAGVAGTSPARAADDLAGEGARRRTYLAFLDGVAVARATACFTEHGVLLFGGATSRDARGRGAYRALVRARWDDAVRAGTPLLVTHAGAMSRPILERLGFRAVSRVHILLDEFDPT